MTILELIGALADSIIIGLFILFVTFYFVREKEKI